MFVRYDSGWFTFKSSEGTESFKELTHNLDILPARMRVDVRVQAVDGDNEGYIFAGMGSAMQSDSRANTFFGGVVFA